eukprot:Gregarina_sp_Pseudo_9__233@NODE_114_length_4196_cov_16_128699_g106_i0_p2_GENE_NODE_114_length_4196_cov_16_128699_g106_i0NODE_114_length_4196_cov_16_128699_g106_i0_p2_ORF_typecomplete_len316_score78_83PTS_2RNA/PF01885_16/1_5e58Pap_E4/PF02711_14/0_048Pap_E4/PF02711_14/6_6e03_NODE_114_length_4196_cov_16_128699_g106_i03111258
MICETSGDTSPPRPPHPSCRAIPFRRSSSVSSLSHFKSRNSSSPSQMHHWTRQETRTCKSLSYVLRHGALLKGLNMRSDGYVKVADLLRLPEFRSLGFLSLTYIVKWNMKRRFSLAIQVDPNSDELMDINPDKFLKDDEDGEENWLNTCDPSKLYIRALQGHSINIIDKSSLYVKVVKPSQIPTCVHGTYWEVWDRILQEGLLRMSRLHIHFARGLPGDPSVLSGIRQNAQVAIYINVPLAMADNIEFWTSHNGVILSEGINGAIPCRYFLKAVTLPDRLEIPLKPSDSPETQQVRRKQTLLAQEPRRVVSENPT